ncbi:MAG: biopolymer transporter ExbD [Candidatus Aminicenantes bacterium]|nr:MAG: biopolymer transporter ExbD [Candidatus Aminicenantes bacterium]
MAGLDLSGSKKSKAEPNVVPLCDILLVLLIIFMVVTPIFKEYRHVKLPEAFHTQNQPEPFSMLTVFIKDNGEIYLDKEPVPELGQLASLIEDKIQGKTQSEKNKLLLKADEEIVYERVTRVMEEIRRAQIEIVGLVAQKGVAVE